MGIAQRNIRDLERAKPQLDGGSAVAARETFIDWLVATVDINPIADEALEALAAAVDAVIPELLLRRANAEGEPYGPSSPHRVAILGWFSNRPEVEAGDIVEWSKAQVLEVIETHGSITRWHAAQMAENEAEEARREAYHAEIQAKAEALKAEARQASLDSETRSILAAAEAFLRESSDG